MTIGVVLTLGFGKLHADKLGRIWSTGIVNVGILGSINRCGICEKVLVDGRVGNCCEKADVDGLGNDTVMSGDMSDVTACATVVGPAVGNVTIVVGTSTVVKA